MLTLPITKSGRGVNSFALTESYLFTKESIQQYLAHLTDEGALIVVAHSMTEAIRLMTTALAALREQGVNTVDAMKRLYVLGHPLMPVFVLNKQPLTLEKAAVLHEALHGSGFDSQLSYIPTVDQVVVDLGVSEGVDNVWRMMNQNMLDLARGEYEPQQWVNAVPMDISPVLDDSPFFYKFKLGIPGEITGLFWFALLLTTAVIFIPWIVRWRACVRSGVPLVSPPWVMILVFAGLGVAFMMIEFALFQKLVLFVGHPTTALSLLLFSLLIGTGVGSLISGRVSNERLPAALWASAISVTISIFIVMYVIKLFADGMLPSNLMTPAMFAFLLIALGIPLGFPFPISIRLLKRLGAQTDIPWMWAVNGATSVVGSVLVIMIAMKMGYNMGLVTGALIYLGIAMIVFYGRGRLLTVEPPAVSVVS